MESRVAQFFSVEERFIVRVRQFIVPNLSHDVEVLAPFLVADAVGLWWQRFGFRLHGFWLVAPHTITNTR